MSHFNAVRAYLQEQIASCCTHAFGQLAPQIYAEIQIGTPKSPQHGDLSCTIAMQLAKPLRKGPPQIARALMEHFSWDESYVEPDPDLSATIIGGFLNFRFSQTYLQQMAQRFISFPESVGAQLSRTPQKYLLEFVSANPTGPMVVVNARAAAIGDANARILQRIGHEVDTEYYVNDFGNQIDLLGSSLLARYKQNRGEDVTIPEGGYAGEYINDLAEKIAGEIPGFDQLPENEKHAQFRDKALEYNIAQQRQILLEYGVQYTRWFRESTLHAEGKPGQVCQILKDAALTYTKDEALWFASSQFGDDKDRVLQKSDGAFTYFSADMAYHLVKQQRGYTQSITFWGPDHHGYLPRLEAAVKALGLQGCTFTNFIIQQFNLISDGKPVRMSKRKGNFVTVEDLLNDVGTDAARYFFLQRRLSTHLDFDLELARKKTEENPVFYVQYAHARTCSLLRHAQQKGFLLQEITQTTVSLDDEESKSIAVHLALFEQTLEQCALYYEPHRLTIYLEQLAGLYHRFYGKHRIITDDRQSSLQRLALTVAVKNAIAEILQLLGVAAPESM